MGEIENAEIVAKMALRGLELRTNLLIEAHGGKKFRIFEILSNISWLLVFVFFRVAFPNNPQVWYSIIPLVVVVILLNGYIKLTNMRVDALIKLIGEDELRKGKNNP
jgi:hypothetical protein